MDQITVATDVNTATQKTMQRGSFLSRVRQNSNYQFFRFFAGLIKWGSIILAIVMAMFSTWGGYLGFMGGIIAAVILVVIAFVFYECISMVADIADITVNNAREKEK